ncbi:unnamed protein product [Linum tenue]|uniref:PLAC8 family protein n=1 Tax=Linum tenue TaxID=586396 RepID=A0AAV0K1F5_9ROSI|nr:unnamed protein product [Linum tenue]
MGSSGNGNQKDDNNEESKRKESQAHVSIELSTSKKTLLGNDSLPKKSQQDSLPNVSNRAAFLKFGSASARFRQLAKDKDDASRLVASSSSRGIRERIHEVCAKKIDWASVFKMSKEWIRDPMNLALFIWILIVAISGAILFLVMTGMLNHALPSKSQRNAWFEVNNQILNALFTLMCLYQHPKRFYHLALLIRWRPDDITKLRKIYCKNGAYKPHEWAHMMVVVLLLHLNCFAQYALCGLNLGYRRSQRPPLGVGLCISVAIAAPAAAGVYSILSPLGKDYDSDMDEEAQEGSTSINGAQLLSRKLEKRYSFATGDITEMMFESRPQWSGGILDFWDDISLAYLSLFCSFCVFGWNMERLGFGNRYVHIATFLLFCMAPFWIFNLAAVNIDNEIVREALGVTGLILCLFGLLYGGFWRIQMRKRFNLPAYTFCFGKPGASDCTLWLCCCWCSLAQEVRTGNAYDVVENRLLQKHTNGSGKQPGSSPARGVSSPWHGAMPDSSSPVKEAPGAKDHAMAAPTPSTIERDGISVENSVDSGLPSATVNKELSV